MEIFCEIKKNKSYLCFFPRLIKYGLILLFGLFFTALSYGQDVVDPTTGIPLPDNANLRLWLDASDINADGSVFTDGGKVSVWKNKATNYASHNPSQSIVGQQPVFRSSAGSTFNEKPALEFSKASSQYLGFDLNDISANWDGPYTLLIMFQQLTVAETYDSFFSSDDSGVGAFQLSYQTADKTGFHWVGNQLVGGANFIYIAPSDLTDSKLFSFTHGGNSAGKEIKVFVDSEQVGGVDTKVDRGFKFGSYLINRNRTGGNFQNSKIAEILIYDRVLTDCELYRVNEYLGVKYGKAFSGFYSAYSHSDLIHEANVIGSQASPCGIDVRNSATSAELTIDNPSSNDQDDFFSVAHNGENISTPRTDIPSGVKYALSKTWRADSDNNIGTVDFTFDVSSSPFTNTNLDYVLLVDSDTDFSNATVKARAGVYDSGKVTFPAVSLSHGEYFTIAQTEKPGGVSSNIRLWLKGDDGISETAGSVNSWQGQTSNDNIFNSLTDAAKPTLQTGLNYNPSLYFDGASNVLENGASLEILPKGNKNNTMFFVGKPASKKNQYFYYGRHNGSGADSGFQYWLTGDTGRVFYHFFAGVDNVRNNYSVKHTYQENKSLIISVRKKIANVDFFIDSKNVGAGYLSGKTGGLTYRSIFKITSIGGDAPYNMNYFHGDISEVIQFDRELDVNERHQILWLNPNILNNLFIFVL